MQMQFPVFFTYPQEQALTPSLFYIPQSFDNFYYFQLPTEQQSSDPCRSSKSEEFLKLFEEELRKISIKYLKKIWTAEDDEILLSLKKEDFRWTEISERIPNSNPQTCKRRFIRLKSNESKWPKELEKEIKRVCEDDSIKWEDKMRILSGKFPSMGKYSKKMIKERYLTYLDDSIDQKPWTIEEDIQLITLIQKGVNRWRMISQAMPGRSELHLKNRYYGCLRAIEKKIDLEIESDCEKRSENSNIFSF